MNKLLLFILLTLSINIFEVKAIDCETITPNEAEDCYFGKLSGNKTHCCYAETSENSAICMPFACWTIFKLLKG